MAIVGSMQRRTIHVSYAWLDKRVLNHEASRAGEHRSLGYELINGCIWDSLEAYLRAITVSVRNSANVQARLSPPVCLLPHLTPVDTFRRAARLQIGAEHGADRGCGRVCVSLDEPPCLLTIEPMSHKLSPPGTGSSRPEESHLLRVNGLLQYSTAANNDCGHDDGRKSAEPPLAFMLGVLLLSAPCSHPGRTL